MSRWKIYNRKVLVEPFQLRFVGVASFHFVLVVVILAFALFTPIVIRLEAGPLSSPEVLAAAREFLVLHTTIWWPLLGAFLLLVLHNIIVTHRIAGPLYRFRRYFRAVGDGDLTSPIRIRKSDYLHKEADAASFMVESLRQKIDQAQERFDGANDAWANLRATVPRESHNELQDAVRDLGEHLEDCRTSLAEFRTGGKYSRPAERAIRAREDLAEIKS